MFGRVLLLLGLVLCVTGCSSTNSDSRELLRENVGSVSSTKMHVDVSDVVLSLQKSGGIYVLYSRPNKVKSIFETAAKAYGFDSVGIEHSVYDVKLKSIFPDGGACESLGQKIISGLSYGLSVLTLGILPATYTHCFVVRLELWEKIDDEWLLVENFESNTGKVDVYGGVNDIDTYQLTVTKRDETRAIEATMVDLLSKMIEDGAFE